MHEHPVENAPVEAKVKASTVGGAVAGAVLWLLATYVFDSGVPEPVELLVYAAIGAVLTFGPGWLARHTYRP